MARFGRLRATVERTGRLGRPRLRLVPQRPIMHECRRCHSRFLYRDLDRAIACVLCGERSYDERFRPAEEWDL